MEEPVDLVLASKSAIRAAMLRGAGLVVEVAPPEVDERALEEAWGALAPEDVAYRLAEAKALAASARHPGALVLGADQTLALGKRRFSKALDLPAARAALMALRGRTHALHSGFALVRDGVLLAGGVASARLTMRALSDTALDDYLERAGPAILGSVGCYQLEGLGVTLFERIEGDHFTILGLPLLAVLAALREQGVMA